MYWALEERSTREIKGLIFLSVSQSVTQGFRQRVTGIGKKKIDRGLLTHAIEGVLERLLHAQERKCDDDIEYGNKVAGDAPCYKFSRVSTPVNLLYKVTI